MSLTLNTKLNATHKPIYSITWFTITITWFINSATNTKCQQVFNWNNKVFYDSSWIVSSKKQFCMVLNTKRH